ncbi:hypothetical protein D3C78_1325190 [compost metagenome]
MAGVFSGDLLLQFENGLMMAQLQDVVDTLAGFLLDQCQLVEDFRSRHQRLFADHITTQTQAGSNMRVMQIVGGADGNVVQCSGRIALDAVGMFQETLELGEELALRRDAVDDADRVVDVVGRDQYVAGFLDGAHVTGGDVTGSADQGEVFHGYSFRSVARQAERPCRAKAA